MTERPDALRAINFALDLPRCLVADFLETWRDGAWDEIKQAYPEYLKAAEESAL